MAKLRITKGREDLWPALLSIDPGSRSDYSYKMEITRQPAAYGFTLTRFKLPRTLPLIYPRSKQGLKAQLDKAEIVLVGNIQNEVIAFACLEGQTYPNTAQITDLVVIEEARQQGIGTVMMLAAEKWAAERKLSRIFIAIPVRNDPMVSLAKKLGYSFCGFMQSHFLSGDDALFYEKRLG